MGDQVGTWAVAFISHGSATDGAADENGLLIHCISGWDRTPLFVSLMRLTLWAVGSPFCIYTLTCPKDGEIHQSLSALEILYLTISYDWLLFGHLLKNRLGRGEEIFLFCFDFLQVICHIVRTS